jgi:catechol 2,3-dioxygenase-like lactoylglutathione lyase family enzyme
VSEPSHHADDDGPDRDGSAHPSRTIQLRLVVETDAFDEALHFYRDGLGLQEEFDIDGEDGARVVALQAGRATLELINAAQRRLIDRVEVGREVSRSIRVAFEVTNVRSATNSLVSAGAALIAHPTPTPWQSLNSRLEAPAGLQITLFEELTSERD